MNADPYTVLAEALATKGWRTQLRSRTQMIISSQDGPVLPDRGNSFWVSHRDGTWYLSTWSPVCYRVPGDQDMFAVCDACMAVGRSAMYRVPAGIASRFGLHELQTDDYDRLLSEASDDE